MSPKAQTSTAKLDPSGVPEVPVTAPVESAEISNAVQAELDALRRQVEALTGQIQASAQPDALSPQDYQARYNLNEKHLELGTPVLDAARQVATREIQEALRAERERLQRMHEANSAQADRQMAQALDEHFYATLSDPVVGFPQWRQIYDSGEFRAAMQANPELVRQIVAAKEHRAVGVLVNIFRAFATQMPSAGQMQPAHAPGYGPTPGAPSAPAFPGGYPPGPGYGGQFDFPDSAVTPRPAAAPMEGGNPAPQFDLNTATQFLDAYSRGHFHDAQGHRTFQLINEAIANGRVGGLYPNYRAGGL